MCRLFVLRSSQPLSVVGALVEASNSLVCQSRADFQGQAHPDGWGIGWYENGTPRVVRSTRPAGEDPDFAVTAAQAHSTTILAHVRQASVGSLSLANTHPFVWGRWMFAHNGTVARFDEVAPRMLDELPARLRDARQGSTDSELIFLWCLARLEQAGTPLEGPAEAAKLGQILEQVTHDLVAWTPVPEGQKPTALNLVLTDGAELAASRWKRTLDWARFEPPGQRGEAEGGEMGETGWAVAVGSEPSLDARWQEVPEGGRVLVTATGRAWLEGPT